MELLGGLLFSLCLVSLVETEVVDSFAASCPSFFTKDQNGNPVTPTVLSSKVFFFLPERRYKQICQKYKSNIGGGIWSLIHARAKRSTDKCHDITWTSGAILFRMFGSHSLTKTEENNLYCYRYATLYDTENKIPVYSAYLYTGYVQTERAHSWMIEPQLDGHLQKEMTYESYVDGAVGINQAVNGDYKNTGYNKGHLYPHCHNCNQAQAESTFTLTNAAPQKPQDNLQWYHQVEKKVAAIIATKCSENSAHVVTGVVPGNNFMANCGWVWCNYKVRVPSHFWTAFCCRDVNNQNSFTLGGYILEMIGDGSADALYQTLSQLNSDLANKYNYNTFEVFGKIQGCS